MDWMLLAYKRYADFEGRSQRKEYWMFLLFQLVVFGIWALIGAAFRESGDPLTGRLPRIMVLPLLVFVLANIIPNLAVSVRRFHDQDRSGWNVLWSLIPYVGGLVVMAFMLLDGTPGPNQYGVDPKGRGVDPRVFS
jgi:uncharacterized membrane protein YhaH (DUF805 family)